MFGLTERAAGVHGDVGIEALADGCYGRKCSANFQRQTGKYQLFSASRFDGACDWWIVESVDRGTVDDFSRRAALRSTQEMSVPTCCPGPSWSPR
jgi:hypothetical protein